MLIPTKHRSSRDGRSYPLPDRARFGILDRPFATAERDLRTRVAQYLAPAWNAISLLGRSGEPPRPSGQNSLGRTSPTDNCSPANGLTGTPAFYLFVVYIPLFWDQDPRRRRRHVVHAVKPLDAVYGNQRRKNRRHDCDSAKDTTAPVPLGQKTPQSAPRGWGLLFTLDHGAVGRSCFPCPRIIDPAVAADYGSRPMRAPDFGVIGKCVT